jgi:L-cysteine:1D-myo-inositol 2-amino-2-deoxy-alpha-D-glucopyranoside ligase
METWPSPERPALPGHARAVRLYDAVSARAAPLAVGDPARMYVCGITPYDATHLGHAFTYVTFDLLHRQWLDAGRSVEYVQNVTDIDDPLLERAVATGQDWRELADRETALFRADMAALRVLPPTHYVGAVESMDLVVSAVATLTRRGAVYSVADDLYFDLTSDDRFGGVAGLGAQEMLALCAERGGDPQRPGKRHPLDPLLWQAARPDEPAWDTPLGHGRPGWHIECTAIALEHLGMTFDVQGGGSDLAYPHHEMCASLAHVATGQWPFARRYVHTGMVGLDGHKMSKSRGNLVFVSRLLGDGVPGAVLRLALLDQHYRSDWEWHDASIEVAATRFERWRSATYAATAPRAEPVVDDVRDALADDLDAPRALRAVDRWAEQTRRGLGDDSTAPGRVADLCDALLGVDLRTAPQPPGPRRLR